ncbi:MAG: FkbM family methyltransferase, partial [Acidobacteria bacterium]|nr:FkbM family methyltransferase [Acidobacteriota bacterium]
VSRNAGAHSFAHSEISSGDVVTVPCTTLDTYCAARGLKPDLIKMDVEGFEIPVMRGGRTTLLGSQPLLIVEFNSYNQCLFGRSCAQLSTWLREDYGYTLVRIDTPEVMTPSPEGVDTYFNVLAIANRRVSSLLHSLPEGYHSLVPDPLYPQWGLSIFR